LDVWGSAEGLRTASDQRTNLGGKDFQLLLQRGLGFVGNESKFPRNLQLGAEFGERSGGNVEESNRIPLTTSGFAFRQIGWNANGSPADLISKKPSRSQRRLPTQLADADRQPLSILPNPQRSITLRLILGGSHPPIQ
jgi:hypothetical protein